MSAETGTPNARVAAMANLPNALTLARIAAIPMIVWLLHRPTPVSSIAAFVIFLVASLTDFLDGYLARRYGLITPLGKLLDPLADKLLIVSSLLMIAVGSRVPTFPAWLLVVIIGRELAVTGLRSIAASEGVVVAAEGTGKLKMTLQIIGVLCLILHDRYLGINFYGVGMITIVVATVVGVWSAVDYHIAVFRKLRDLP